MTDHKAEATYHPAAGAPLNIMGYTDQDAETAITLAIGGASMCWEPRPAGVFDSATASQITDELITHLRKLRLLPDEQEHRP